MAAVALGVCGKARRERLAAVAVRHTPDSWRKIAISLIDFYRVVRCVWPSAVPPAPIGEDGRCVDARPTPCGSPLSHLVRAVVF